jgi:hypothetical protein
VIVENMGTGFDSRRLHHFNRAATSCIKRGCGFSFCTHRKAVHEWYTFSLDFHDGREILYGISCPLFAGSTVDVPTHVDGGVAGQFLKFFGRNVSVFNQKPV